MIISRQSAYAALFAIVATASLAFAADARDHRRQPQVVTATAAVAHPIRVVELERVVVTGKRLPQA